ncbi:DUF4432 family protein [Rhizobium deserti]|uniref:DUF4432 family protein n=1 Tax=Rhizobium deserti TaxID=2547961 RepID=A0A4R5UMB8_9HYPH|nr:DUF4432 family protein [Rhizobium deserti]TDK38899.1 DUF4432 family protein [Rhizobium deserti]
MKAFSTGLGPKLFLDEGSVFDIQGCFIGDTDLSPGRSIPDDGDSRIDHSLEGFLFTCGPDHIRHPEPIAGAAEGKTYPLHGSFSAHPAKIMFWDAQGGDAECRAQVDVTMATGEPAQLDRHWRIDGMTGEVCLLDKVTNTGTKAFAPVHMYHMNIGAWLFDEHVRLSGQMLEDGVLPWSFGPDPGSVFCVPARQDGEQWAELCLGPIAAIGGLTLKVKFKTDTLPHLQVWRNQKAPAHVLGIEPVSHRLASREELARQGELVMLKPGESIEYALKFHFA